MNIPQILMLKEAASSLALENNWTKKEEDAYFMKALEKISSVELVFDDAPKIDFDFLVGKTVTSAKLVGCKSEMFGDSAPCDGENTLELYFSDGTSCELVGGYGGFTGKSCDEYFEVLGIQPIQNRKSK